MAGAIHPHMAPMVCVIGEDGRMDFEASLQAGRSLGQHYDRLLWSGYEVFQHVQVPICVLLIVAAFTVLALITLMLHRSGVHRRLTGKVHFFVYTTDFAMLFHLAAVEIANRCSPFWRSIYGSILVDFWRPLSDGPHHASLWMTALWLAGKALDCPSASRINRFRKSHPNIYTGCLVAVAIFIGYGASAGDIVQLKHYQIIEEPAYAHSCQGSYGLTMNDTILRYGRPLMVQWEAGCNGRMEKTYWTKAIFGSLLPIVLIALSTAALLPKLRASETEANDLTPSHRVLSSLAWWCVATEVPKVLALIAGALLPGGSILLVYFAYPLRYLMILNAAGKLILGCMLSRRFRKSLKQTANQICGRRSTEEKAAEIKNPDALVFC